VIIPNCRSGWVKKQCLVRLEKIRIEYTFNPGLFVRAEWNFFIALILNFKNTSKRLDNGWVGPCWVCVILSLFHSSSSNNNNNSSSSSNNNDIDR
jgi:hypothetical protein